MGDQDLMWLKEQKNISFDARIEEQPELRGIYGIFVEDECAYVGRATNGIYYRFFSGDCQARNMRLRECVPKINDALEKGLHIDIRILDVVPPGDECKAKEAQKLASRECFWIDHYQALNQCLEQLPAGNWGNKRR